MPQIFLFPIHRKPHGVGVNGRIIRKQGLQFGGHVVVWRNDVKKILDNAKTEIHFLLIDIVRNPRSCHATHSQSPQCKSSVPHTRMVATIVSRDCDDGHPRHEHRHSQRKLLRNLFPDLVALDVFVNFGQNTQGKNLGQHPRWWIWLRISGAKVLDEIFSRFCQFRVYKLLCLHKLFCIVKACQVGHPKRIACFSAGDIHDSTSYPTSIFSIWLNINRRRCLSKRYISKALSKVAPLLNIWVFFGIVRSGYKYALNL